MSQNKPLSDHLSSLALDSSDTLFKESDSEHASEGENAQFHSEFPDVPKDEQLLVYVDDELRPLYVSEKHVYLCSFDEKSMISMDDMIALYIERDKRDFIFKFQLITRHTTLNKIFEKATESGSNAVYRAFNIIRNRWSACLHRASVSRRDSSLENLTFKQTECMCSKEGNHGKVCMEGVFLGTPKEIHHLLNMSEVGKNYWCTEMQKGNYKDIQISDWSSADTRQGQEHPVQAISYKYAGLNIKMHKEIIHCDFNDYISIMTKESSFPSFYHTTQCIMWETAESSRLIIAENNEEQAQYSTRWRYPEFIDQLWSSLCDHAVWKLDGIHVLLSLETAQDIMFSPEPSDLAPVLDLILSKGTSPNLSLDYHQRYMKFLRLLIKKHKLLPPSLFVQDNLHTLLDLDPETAGTILCTLEPSRVSSLLDLLIAQAKSQDLDHQKCIMFLGLLVRKHDITVPSLFVEENIHNLVDVDPETTNTILSALEPSRVSSVLDLLIAQAKSDLDPQKCIKFLGLLVSKHDITVPSLFVEENIHTLVDVGPETTNTILSSLEPSTMPPILDLILSEAKLPNSDPSYCQKCMRLFQILVKKHNIMLPSIFMQDNICTLVSLDPEAPDSILFAVEPLKIPPVLDLLLTEAKKPELNHEYCRKCLKWLRLLVNKHHVLPPSLFLQEIIIPNLHIAAVGGYSDIYKGVFESKQVCLKVLRVYIEDGEEKRNKDLRDFYKETLLWTHLNHSNLLPFLGVNTTLFPGRLALVAPWMANRDITKFLKANPTHDRLKVISAIAAGIMYLHSRNIVHGDIKGANVLVDELGNCYLADFGLATAAMTSTLLSTATGSGGKGTMRWMAPELLTSGETEEDDKSSDHLDQDSPKPDVVQLARDIYAYACTVYEIIAGKIPFAHLRHDPQVMFQVLSGNRPGRPTATAWCPNSIWNLVEQCWAQNSHLRPTAAVVHGYLIHLEELREKELPWEEELLGL